MNTLMRIRTAAAAVIAALLFATTASAETLMMPDRQGLMNQTLVVWGVTTQANGTPITIDFGDGTPVVSGTVGDRSYIPVTHTYTAQKTYTATMTVGAGSSAETATVNLEIFDGSQQTAENLRDLKINLAIEDGLRYLWTTQDNRAARFPGDPTTDWDGSPAWTSMVTLAFENQSHHVPNDNSTPTGLYEKYIVRRGLNYIVDRLQQVSLNVQPAGDPCVNVESAPCTGLQGYEVPGYGTAVSMLPIAASGALLRQVTEVGGSWNGGFVVGKTLGNILQRMTDTLAWGQNDTPYAGRGGWHYNFNDPTFDGSTVGWDVLALLDSSAAGVTVPAFVPSEFVFGLNNALNNDGTLDYNNDNCPTCDNNTNPAKAGVALESLFFTNVVAAAQGSGSVAGSTTYFANVGNGVKGNNTLNYLSAFWNSGSFAFACGNGATNKNCPYAMFNIFKGLKLQGIRTLAGVNRAAGPGSIPANDWYADYQDWLVANQSAPTNPGGGNWPSMYFSCCNNSQNADVALAELILSPVALVLPDGQAFSNLGLSQVDTSSLTYLSHNVTGHAQSANGSPVAAVTINFQVMSGPNAGATGSGQTDANGDAQFSYPDNGGAGTDVIQAFIGSGSGKLSSNTVSFQWQPRELTATVTAANKQYDSTNTATMTGCSVSGPILAGDTVGCSASTGTFDDANVGTGKTVTSSGITLTGASAANYVLGSSTATTTADITAAPLTITAKDATKPYGTPLTFNGTEFTTSGLLGTDTVSSVTLTSAGAAATATVAGSPYSIVPSAAAGSGVGNYNITYTNGSLKVTPAALTITATSLTKTYGQTATLTFTTSALQPGDSVTGVTLASAGAAATAPVSGSPYSITASNAVGVGLGNYTIAYVSGSLTVSPAALTITAANQNKPYGTALASTTTTAFTATGLVNGDTVASVSLASAGAPATAAVGAYPLTPSAAVGTGLNNYTIGYANGTLTVTQAALTITAKNELKAVGQTETFTGTEFTVTGLLNGNTVSSVTLASAGAIASAAPGQYAIVPSAAVGSGLTNYLITYLPGALTVVGVAPSTGSLWPPNHKMVPITISIADGNAPLACSISNVTSSEPINGLGDGDTAPDWAFAPPTLTLDLRSERAGNGPGRTYTVFVTCTDTSTGNSATTSTTVSVPHDMSK